MSQGEPVTSRDNRFERHKMLTLFLVVAVSLLALDLAAGTLFLKKSKLPNERVSDPYYNHGLKANFEGDEPWAAGKYKIFTNSLGFKDRARREVPLVSDAHRLVFIGDSFTEGIGIGFDQTFVGRIAEALSPRGYEVLNAGVASYSPTIYYLKIKHLLEQGFTFDELAVFIDISDVQDELWYEEYWRPTTPYALRYVWDTWWHGFDRWLADHSFVYLHGVRPVLLGFTGKKLQAYFFGGGIVSPEEQKYVDDRGRWTFDETVFEEWGREGVELELKHMNMLHSLLLEKGIQMSVAVYPWPEQERARDLDSRQVSIWRTWAEEKGVPFINLFPAFIATSTPVEDLIALYHLPNDTHWTEAGHEVVAKNWLEHYHK